MCGYKRRLLKRPAVNSIKQPKRVPTPAAIPRDTNGMSVRPEWCFGRTVLHRIAPGDEPGVRTSRMLFFNGCPDRLRVVLHGLGRGLGHSSQTRCPPIRNHSYWLSSCAKAVPDWAWSSRDGG